MPKRSRRRGSRSSRRRTWIALALLVLIAVSGLGVYVYTAKPAPTTPLDTYAVLDTTQGTIVIQLFPQVAPKTVGNFETLANSSFDDLVPGYIKFVPEDITGRTDSWVTETEDSEDVWDPNQTGIKSVHSGSDEMSSDGSGPYSSWTH